MKYIVEYLEQSRSSFERFGEAYVHADCAEDAMGFVAIRHPDAEILSAEVVW